jgi:hypothetical protein
VLLRGAGPYSNGRSRNGKRCISWEMRCGNGNARFNHRAHLACSGVATILFSRAGKQTILMHHHLVFFYSMVPCSNRARVHETVLADVAQCYRVCVGQLYKPWCVFPTPRFISHSPWLDRVETSIIWVHPIEHAANMAENKHIRMSRRGITC